MFSYASFVTESQVMTALAKASDSASEKVGITRLHPESVGGDRQVGGEEEEEKEERGGEEE